MVEDARETKPPYCVSSPAIASVDEAPIAPEALMRRERLPNWLYTLRTSAVWFALGTRAKVVVAVEVEVTEKTAKGEDEPTDTLPSFVTAKKVEEAADEYPLPVNTAKANPGVEDETTESAA